MAPFQPRSRPVSPYSFPRSYQPYNMPPQMPMRPRKGGGLLRNLLGKKGGSGGRSVAGFERQRSAGSFVSPAAQKLANPASLQDILANTQQFLQTMQQMGPVVQQYGPWVKNLPTMWKLYRGLKNLPDVETETSEEPKSASMPESENNQSEPRRKKQQAPSAARKPARKPPSKPERSEHQHTGSSKPKLYI